ncbi:GAF domain-containing sensor histidine kinase [Paraburkholderia sp. D15]|uniref:GAF domain-containing sensor histidine kinase n=1 Tax=Paraburkholderia sp. D15 TaxID=2880218 RepID=UPI00247A6556|nr:GAF domain-containing sensor histidine kinase [Paraburkholderia sp. D15]WGS48125.1 GAF domain-containing sensor histidine kinase [Paraburkholderia sp. D15]WKF55993.1 Bacteriophytochrome [Paraburkholderia busanensis]
MNNLPAGNGEEAQIARDIEAVQRIDAVPAILRLICRNTGMGFAAVARVTGQSWTACAVQDDVAFGLAAGGQLDLRTTLCFESRAARATIVIDNFSDDPVYRGHHTARIYNLGSYISVPIILPDGSYFGNLCAIDPKPAEVSNPRTLSMFEGFADLIALQLASEGRHQAVRTALFNERETASLREQFIAVLGHDLRNPLSAVSATAELLALRKHEPDLVKIGLRLKATTLRMARLIDDVMDFARGRLGSGIGVSIDEVDDLDTALRMVVAELREAHPDRLLADDIAIGARVRCDRTRVQQLLSNLVGNAVTHGAAAFPVRVLARIEGAELVLSVVNGGEEIAPEVLARVFEPYWRPATSKPGGGLGLGLYICKQIVSAHGGTLEVQSSAQDGTRFVARLPMAV